jgi:hypothetical protein
MEIISYKAIMSFAHNISLSLTHDDYILTKPKTGHDGLFYLHQ